MHHSSANVNRYIAIFQVLRFSQGLIFLKNELWCPHGIAVAVAAKNSPLDCFINATTVLKEIISTFGRIYKNTPQLCGVFFVYLFENNYDCLTASYDVRVAHSYSWHSQTMSDCRHV